MRRSEDMNYTNLKDIRVKLDQATERITSRLKDRSRFLQNPSIYKPDAVKIEGRMGISFLDFALEGIEKYHASLGRYEYSDQTPLVIKPHHSRVEREISSSSIEKVKINVKDEIMRFYLNFIKRACAPGEDKISFGETAYCDADIMEMLNERINLGKFVAESKYRTDPSISEVIHSDELLESKLRNRAREQEVLENVRAAASRYDLDQVLVEDFFKDMIDVTTKLEMEYLRRKFESKNNISQCRINGK